MFSTLAIQQAYGDTALHAAAQYGHEILIPMLLEAGAEIDSQDNNGRTPLHIACFSGEEAAVRALLKGNPDVKLRSNDGMTALDEARQENHALILYLMFDYTHNLSRREIDCAEESQIVADPDKALWEECSHGRGRLNKVKEYLDLGANPNTKFGVRQDATYSFSSVKIRYYLMTLPAPILYLIFRSSDFHLCM